MYASIQLHIKPQQLSLLFPPFEKCFHQNIFKPTAIHCFRIQDYHSHNWKNCVKPTGSPDKTWISWFIFACECSVLFWWYFLQWVSWSGIYFSDIKQRDGQRIKPIWSTCLNSTKFCLLLRRRSSPSATSETGVHTSPGRKLVLQ